MNIQTIKTKTNTELLVNIYISEDAEKIIIAPTAQNNAGLYFEQEMPTVLSFYIQEELVGQATRKAFEAFTLKDVKLRDKKATDWPAYLASKAKSIKAFERDFTFLSAKTEGANIILSGWPLRNSKIIITKYTLAYDEPLFGRDIIEVYKCCRHLAETYFK